MPKPIYAITGQDLMSGMSIDDRHSTVGFSSIVGFDIYSKPGTAISTNPLTSINNTTVDQKILQFEPFDGDVYAYASGGDLYKIDGSTGSTVTLARAVATSSGNGLRQFAGKLYYFRNTDCGRYDGTDFDDDYWTAVAAGGALTSTEHPSVVFARTLFFGNGNKVASLQSNETTQNDAALTLPSNYNIYSMCVWNGFIVLGTKDSTNLENERVILWDGVSATISQEIEIPKQGASALINYNNLLKAFIGKNLFYYTGSDFAVEKAVVKGLDKVNQPTAFVNSGAVEIYEEKIVFGFDFASSNVFTPYGIYAIGRHSAETENAMCVLFTPPSSLYNEATAIYSGNIIANGRNDLYVAWTDATNTYFCISRLGTTTLATGTDPYILTNVINISTDFGRKIKGVKVETPDTMLVTVSYRIDDDIDVDDESSDFTELGQLNATTGQNILYGINKIAKKIQFKFVFDKSQSTGHSIENIYIY